MKWNEHLLLWNHASVKVMDVRHAKLEQGQGLRSYPLPTSTFMYVVQGGAQIGLGGMVFAVKGSFVLHGGKGMLLDITVEGCETCFEYYMILYKAVISLPRRREMLQMVERNQFLNGQYAFATAHPLLLFDTIRRMDESWRTIEGLERLNVKSLFYQFVYELLRQQRDSNAGFGMPDLAEQAKRYMLEHYEQQLSLETLAQALGCSAGHLSKLFKNRLGDSPMHFLTRLRVDRVAELLVQTEGTLQEIAESAGYPDGYTLSRSFKKHMGMSPSRYREMGRDAVRGENVPSTRQGYAILPDSFWLYIDNDYHNQYKRGDHHQMNPKRKTITAAALLCLTLLLAACSSGTTATTAGGANAQGGVASAAPVESVSATAGSQSKSDTRVVSTVLGDVLVPANPQRVLVQYLMGDVLALGVQPVGISEVYDGAAFSEQAKESTDLGHWAEWDPEAVMALEPDLIITADEEQAKELSKIAPAIFVPYGEITEEERVKLIGQALNKEKEAEQVLADYKANVESSKQKLKEAGFGDKTVSVFEGGKDSITVMGKLFGTGRVAYDVLSMNAPEAVQTNIIGKDSYSESISFEVLPDYAGDYIIRNTYEGMDDLSQNDVWNSLPAIKSNHLIEMEFGLSYYSDIYSANAQVDYIVNALLKSAQQ